MRRVIPVSSRVAIVLSPALGDSLLMMTVARNLRNSGIEVTVFGRQAVYLKDWFPNTDIRHELDEKDLDEQLRDFDLVIQLHRDRPFADLDRRHHNVMLLDHVCRAHSHEAMAERLARCCREEIGLGEAGKDNGICAPLKLQHRKHMRRVAIHPMASTSDKRWLASRFIQLAQVLRERGFSPQFVVAAQERTEWAHLERSGLSVPKLDSLAEVAALIYESGWFIGNDSGVGHLASNLRVPTLSLFMRNGLARTWRPSWGVGHVLVGSNYLPTSYLKERYWKYMLTVGTVMQAFERLYASAS
ncbi:glycosyltransferase family 9 protein [Paraburkholderia sp. ZP32-5]|uniref:glycosyltransferase family 9 protein n=1 Tax=Paraburkholderia sp. ZP32-5 TaxID=2883245 RepID=UPI001F16FDC8|nr:glycosyltransferase family 9 protein [Paraburkholderia sp. ZP32-5]